MQLAFVLLSAVLCCGLTSLTLARADDIVNAVDLDTYDDERAKRPFCNAFTGCGRKRSGSGAMAAAAPLPAARPLPLRSDDPMTTLFDLNAEPAVAELSRQILSEAKLWEAIREASRDEGRRQHSLEQAPRRLAALRSFRRRRSASPLPVLNKVAASADDQDRGE